MEISWNFVSPKKWEPWKVCNKPINGELYLTNVFFFL